MTTKPQKYNIYEIFLNCQSGKLLIVDDKMILVVSPDKKIIKTYQLNCCENCCQNIALLLHIRI